MNDINSQYKNLVGTWQNYRTSFSHVPKLYSNPYTTQQLRCLWGNIAVIVIGSTRFWPGSPPRTRIFGTQINNAHSNAIADFSSFRHFTQPIAVFYIVVSSPIMFVILFSQVYFLPALCPFFWKKRDLEVGSSFFFFFFLSPGTVFTLLQGSSRLAFVSNITQHRLLFTLKVSTYITNKSRKTNVLCLRSIKTRHKLQWLILKSCTQFNALRDTIHGSLPLLLSNLHFFPLYNPTIYLAWIDQFSFFDEKKKNWLLKKRKTTAIPLPPPLLTLVKRLHTHSVVLHMLLSSQI